MLSKAIHRKRVGLRQEHSIPRSSAIIPRARVHVATDNPRYFPAYREAARVCEGLSHQAYTITFAPGHVWVIDFVNKRKAGLNSKEAFEFVYLMSQPECPNDDDARGVVQRGSGNVFFTRIGGCCVRIVSSQKRLPNQAKPYIKIRQCLT